MLAGERAKVEMACHCKGGEGEVCGGRAATLRSFYLVLSQAGKGRRTQMRVSGLIPVNAYVTALFDSACAEPYVFGGRTQRPLPNRYVSISIDVSVTSSFPSNFRRAARRP